MSFPVRLDKSCQVQPGYYSLPVRGPLFIFNNQQLALHKIQFKNVIYNIAAAYGNNSFSYSFNNQTFTLVFPDGYYTVSDLNQQIQQDMFNRGFYNGTSSNPTYLLSLVYNSVFDRTTLSLTPSTSTGSCPQLVITSQNSGNIIGFNTGTYPSTVSNTATLINGQNSPSDYVSSIIVQTNCTSTREINRNESAIACFKLTAPYGSIQTIEPPYPAWYPLISGDFSSIDVYFRDQNGAYLMMPADCSIELLVQPRPPKVLREDYSKA